MRAVANMVAAVHLDPPHVLYDTIIYLDNDRENVAASNLMWRPRWFARQYHSQFVRPHNFRSPYLIELIETGEVGTIREFAVKYGLLKEQIILNLGNPHENFVMPHGYNFRFSSDVI